MSLSATVSALRIIANLAMSADGKIDSVDFEGGGFGSRADRERMDLLRAASDAIVVGAGTVRSEDPPLRVRDDRWRAARVAEGRAPELIVAVVSATGAIPPEARFLREPAAARWLVVPGELDERALAPLAGSIRDGRLSVVRCGTRTVDLQELAGRLAAHGCQRALVEGGGELVASFLAADLLDELCLTLCPVIIGGRTAPTPVGGAGWPLALARRARLVALERNGDELFLRYAIERRD